MRLKREDQIVRNNIPFLSLALFGNDFPHVILAAEHVVILQHHACDNTKSIGKYAVSSGFVGGSDRKDRPSGRGARGGARRDTPRGGVGNDPSTRQPINQVTVICGMAKLCACQSS